MLGAIEAGGTKFVCGVGTSPADFETCHIPTTLPDATLAAVFRFFHQHAAGQLEAVGIGSFGPVDLDPTSRKYGHITSTPKRHWANYDLVGTVKRTLGIPVGFDTDVNAAALGEARWGGAPGLRDFVYLTIGTGIGGGAMIGGEILHGLVHSEMGHMRIPHDMSADPFAGCCPFHRDCLEGLASAPAIRARWGIDAHDLPADHAAWPLEASYLALAVANLTLTLSPRRILLGGGVMRRSELFTLIRMEVSRILNGYIQHDEILNRLDEYIAQAQLGVRAGVLGALILAEHALHNQS